MTEDNEGDPGEVITPHHHTLIVSPDRLNIGVVFDSHNHRRMTIIFRV
jgi:hypothetical protein